MSLNETRQQQLQELYATLDKDVGKGVGRPLPEREPIPISRLSTGSPSVDYVTGGGIPRGRITEVFGTESGGKTTLCLMLMAQLHRTDENTLAAFIDAEHAYDPAWAERMGVDLERTLFEQPDTGEQALEITDRMVRSGVVDLIVIDSVSALVPRAELEGDISKAHVGLQARMMSKAMRKLVGPVQRSNCAVVFINQIREKIGVTFGSPETTPGGRALKFAASVRLDVRAGTALKQGDDRIGTDVKVRCVKNKVSRPHLRAETHLLYEFGIDRAWELLVVGTRCGLFTKSGSWYHYRGERIGNGKPAAARWLREQPAVMDELHELCCAHLETGEVYN